MCERAQDSFTIKTRQGSRPTRESAASFIYAWYAYVEAVCDDVSEPREYAHV